MSISSAVDASAVARVLGVKTVFKNLRRNGVARLPQRVAVFGQGNTANVFATTKRQVTSALEVGEIYGFGSPLHAAVSQLLPTNGDGVGTIPVTVYPLVDGTTAASGSITPSGTQVTAASYRAVINGVASIEFVVLAAASITTICRSIFTAINSVLGFPVLPSYTYGVVTSAPGGSNVGNGTVTALSVVGTPVPGVYALTCTGAVANGGVFSLTNPDGLVTTGLTLTPAPGGATVLNSNGIQFTVTDGATDFAVADTFAITVPATAVTLTAKWKGLSGNSIRASIEGSTTAGVTYAIVQPAGGLGDPTVDAALAQVGNVWETMAVNCLTLANTTALDAYSTFGDGRWGALVRKPLVFLTGTTEANPSTAVVLPNARLGDRTNGQIAAPGCANLPWVLAARAVSRMAVLANDNPAYDYGRQRLLGLVPGTDAQQWDYVQRNFAVTNGSSTSEVVDGVIYLADVVTFYHPTGDVTPAYRFVVDIVKLQNVIFNIDLEFNTPEWDGAPLIPDNQPTTNRAAKKPKAAVAAMAGIIDGLGLEAIISDPAAAKAATVAEIDSGNPKRLNLSTTVQLAGNTNIKSIDLNFGFFFGTPAIVN